VWPLLTPDQYFKSIEKVASELGFRQMLPRKRDSVVEDEINVAAFRTNGSKLALPQIDVSRSASRSASPLLGPMSARISDEEANIQAMDALSEPHLTAMSERVAV
jgi:glucosamine-6-phosphate deaminase